MDSQKALQALKEEKETALKDLNSVECSLSELFQRYESMRRSIDGFLKVRHCRAEKQIQHPLNTAGFTRNLCVLPQNEALLKKCAEDCVAWVKKEQERYHTLKHYAEGKIEMYGNIFKSINLKFCFFYETRVNFSTSIRANKEIAQVRAKFSSEKMVLTTNLRQEQLKINVLEQSMQQKVRELILINLLLL